MPYGSKKEKTMSKLAKILVTIGIVILWMVFATINMGIRKEMGMTTPGIMGVVILVAAVAGIRAIWKKNKDTDVTKRD